MPPTTTIQLFLSQIAATARRDLAYAAHEAVRPLHADEATQLVRQAIDAWHSHLSQPEFFALLDACGGLQAVEAQVHAALDAREKTR